MSKEHLAAQDIIDSLVTIGNAKKVKQACEPNVAEPLELKEWMVVRCLMARGLFMQEWERDKTLRYTEPSMDYKTDYRSQEASR